MPAVQPAPAPSVRPLRLLLALGTLLALLLGASVTLAPSASASTGSVSGRVTAAEGGAPVANAYVQAYRWVDEWSYWNWAGSTFADGNGEYTISGLSAGDHHLRVSRYDYAATFSGDVPNLGSVVPFPVADGQGVTGLDFALDAESRVEGVLSDPDGEPLDVSAEAYAQRLDEVTGIWDTVQYVGVLGGQYSIGGLAAGTYRVVAQLPGVYPMTYYGDVAVAEQATRVTVPAETTMPGLDIRFVEAASWTGTITGTGGAPVEGAQVALLCIVEGNWTWSDDTFTDEAGAYSLTGLAPYSCTLYVTADGYVEYYLGGATYQGDAERHTLVPGGTVERDFTLTAGATVSGTVTGPDGPLVNAAVGITTTDGDYVEWAYTDDDGAFTSDPFPAGEVTLIAFADPYPALYLGGAYEIELAETFTAEVGQHYAGKDIELFAGATVSGQITLAGGEPAADASVALYRQSHDGEWAYMNGVDTPDGAFAFDELPPGTYLVEAWADGYPSTYSGGVRTEDEATPFVVAGGQSVTADVELLAGTRVSGTITDVVGQPEPDATVALFRWDADDDEWDYWEDTSVAGDGSYWFGNLEAGTYTVSAKSPTSPYVYLGDVEDMDDATTFALIDGQHATGKDVRLTTGASLSGRVTGTAGAPVADAEVSVLVRTDDSGDWSYSDYAVTDEDGYYTFGGLPEGRALVYVWSEDYPATWFGDTYDETLAQEIVLSKATPQTGKDVQLTAGGTIQGVVTGPDDEPFGDAWVSAYRWHAGDERWYSWSDAATDLDGTYTLGRLEPGTYKVTANGAGHARGFHGGTDLATATSVVVGSGDVAEDVDVRLGTGRTVSGTVTGPDGQPYEDAEVSLYWWDGSGWSSEGSWAYTDEDGRYTLTGAGTGTYTVSVYSEHPTIHLGGKGRRANAERFTVTGSGVTGIDVRLVEEIRTASIAGTITRTGGAKVGGATVTPMRLDGSTWVAGDPVTTDSAGRYEATGLAGDDWTVRVEAAGLPTTYLGGASVASAADSVHLEDDEELTGLDLELFDGAYVPTGAATTTTLTLSKAKRAYGTTSTATVTVSAASGKPSGTVVLRSGSATVGTATLKDGRATITLARTLKVRKHSLTATYAGSTTHRTSSSAVRALQVTKARAKVAVKQAKKKPGRAVVRVKAEGVVAKGKVVVKRGAKVVARKTLVKGKAVFAKLPRGAKVKVVYAGGPTTSRATKTVTVRG